MDSSLTKNLMTDAVISGLRAISLSPLSLKAYISSITAWPDLRVNSSVCSKVGVTTSPKPALVHASRMACSVFLRLAISAGPKSLVPLGR